MPLTRTRLSAALLILRLGIGAFLVVWASLKFLRPEWMGNVFRGTYGLTWLQADVGLTFAGLEFGFNEIAYAAGTLQMLLVIVFILGLWRTLSYGAVTVMHGTGIIGALLSGNVLFKGGVVNAISTGTFEIGYTTFPANLLWTSVTTLTALIALFILRHQDDFTLDGLRKRDR